MACNNSFELKGIKYHIQISDIVGVRITVSCDGLLDNGQRAGGPEPSPLTLSAT